MRCFFLFLILFSPIVFLAQNLTGEQLLDNAIKYHDPTNSWPSFKGIISITMSTPDGKKRASDITLDHKAAYFQLISIKEGTTIQQTLNKGECELMLNGSNNISKDDIKKHRLTCERVKTMRNYYTYLYGLPMKLKDNGTILESKTEKKTFKGKEYLVLKATYPKEIGKDTWYFYFDPKTYALQVYQFFHDQSKNDGEYILLTDEEDVLEIKMPKTRAWYYNKDNKYLGTDVITKTATL